MSTMLAARDQENLVHGHQQAAASKPLNQGTRQLAPKTPGNKAPKTPFKLPLNDENRPGIFGAGKSSFKNNGKGDENAVTGARKGGLGDKDAFKTPIGPRDRAPLGLKTTNAKTKAFHIPPPTSVEDVPIKSQQESASSSARKGRPRVSHAEMTKLDIHGDLDKLKEMDIEYMPPPAKNLPDYPDDIHETNLTPFPGGKGIMETWWQDALHAPGEDGLSYVEREKKELEKTREVEMKEHYARAIFESETALLFCDCEPECPGETCKQHLATKKAAGEKYQKTMAELHPERKPADSRPVTRKPPTSKPPAQTLLPSKGPSTLSSKSAATLLSQPKPSGIVPKPKPQLNTAKPRIPFSNISSRKQTPPPTNPSPMRHTAATLASKTTIGRSAGRVASATYRKHAAPAKKPAAAAEVPDTSLPPAEYVARYGMPKAGTRMWERFMEEGCFSEGGRHSDQGMEVPPLEELLREGAEEEFVLEL